MRTKVFMNLPVRDLDRSKAFFEALGWSINPNFTDATAACVVVSEEIHVMLLTHQKFGEFSPRPVAPMDVAEVLIALGVESPDQLNRIVDAALANGGREAMPAKDYGFMQYRTFIDLDGHHWEITYMDPASIPAV